LVLSSALPLQAFKELWVQQQQPLALMLPKTRLSTAEAITAAVRELPGSTLTLGYATEFFGLCSQRLISMIFGVNLKNPCSRFAIACRE